MRRKREESLSKEETQQLVVALLAKMPAAILVEELHVTSATVSNWKNGKTSAPLALADFAKKNL